MKASEYPDQIFLFETGNEIVWADAHPREIVPDTDWDEDDGAILYVRIDTVTAIAQAIMDLCSAPN